jgi:hypothetical protein
MGLEVHFSMVTKVPHEMEHSQDKRNPYHSQHNEGFRAPEVPTPMGEELVIPNKQKQSTAQ